MPCSYSAAQALPGSRISISPNAAMMYTVTNTAIPPASAAPSVPFRLLNSFRTIMLSFISISPSCVWASVCRCDISFYGTPLFPPFFCTYHNIKMERCKNFLHRSTDAFSGSFLPPADAYSGSLLPPADFHPDPVTNAGFLSQLDYRHFTASSVSVRFSHAVSTALSALRFDNSTCLHG